MADTDPTPPRLLEPDHSRDGGRGLLLIARLSLRWGLRRTEHGKVIWARMPGT